VYLQIAQKEEHKLDTQQSTSHPYQELVGTLILITMNFDDYFYDYTMTTDDETSGSLVLGDQPASSSSSSSSSDGISSAKDQGQETFTNPPKNIQVATTIPALVTVTSTVPTTNHQPRPTATAVTAVTTLPMTVPTTVPRTTNNKRTYSIAHDDWIGHRAIIFHVDLEHGGDACGVLQLSVVAYGTPRMSR
jgi:hypothetical protein